MSDEKDKEQTANSESSETTGTEQREITGEVTGTDTMAEVKE